jgi:hypothetical protein
MLLEEQGPPAELKTIETPLLLSNTVYCNRLKPVKRATSPYITSSAPREGDRGRILWVRIRVPVSLIYFFASKRTKSPIFRLVSLKANMSGAP